MSVEKEVARFGPFAQAIANGVKKGNAIYLSGQVGVDSEGKVVGDGDLAAQVRQAYVNVEETLGKFGATMDDIVDETWFVTDVASVMGDMKNIFGVRAAAYGGQPQVCQTLIQIGALVLPELLVEIKCIAHV